MPFSNTERYRSWFTFDNFFRDVVKSASCRETRVNKSATLTWISELVLLTYTYCANGKCAAVLRQKHDDDTRGWRGSYTSTCYQAQTPTQCHWWITTTPPIARVGLLLRRRGVTVSSTCLFCESVWRGLFDFLRSEVTRKHRVHSFDARTPFESGVTIRYLIRNIWRNLLTRHNH